MADELMQTFAEVMEGYEQNVSNMAMQGVDRPETNGVAPQVPLPGEAGGTPIPSQVGADPSEGQVPHPSAPTTPPPPDAVAMKERGQQQVQQQLQALDQQSQQTPVPPPPQPPGPSPSGGMGAGIEAMRSTQARMRAGQMQNPAMISAMSDPSNTMMPDPSLLTTPGMGAFRTPQIGTPSTMAPFSISGQPPPQGLIPGLGMERTRPPLQFDRPFDSAISRAEERSMLAGQEYSAFAQSTGRAITGMFGGAVGGLAGAAVGGAIGGPGTAATMGEWGMLAGSLGGSMLPGVGEATAAAFRPAIERRYDTIRTRMATRNFMSGGDPSETDITGTGLSPGAADELVGEFDQMADRADGINRRDITNITQMASETGLLDMAGDTEEIADTVKRITSLVGTFAKVTGTPDFKENIREIARMRQMGVPLDEMGEAARNMDQYARQAGMSTQQMVSRSGMQGATAFQQAGLVPGAGIETGAFGRGTAQTAINAGAFNQQQLGMFGGASGIGQTLTQGQASFMQGPLAQLMPFMLSQGEEGGFNVREGAMEALASGDISFQEAQQRAMERGQEMGASTVGEMRMRQGELVSRIQEEAGPQQMNMAMINSVRSMAEGTGMDPRNMAYTMFGRRQGQAIAEIMESPEAMNALERQQRYQERRQEFAQRQATPSRIQQFNQQPNIFESAGNALVRPIGAIQRGMNDLLRQDMQSRRLEAIGAAQRNLAGGVTELTDAERDRVDLTGGAIPTGRERSGFDRFVDVSFGDTATIRQSAGTGNFLTDMVGGAYAQDRSVDEQVSIARNVQEAARVAGQGRQRQRGIGVLSQELDVSRTKAADIMARIEEETAVAQGFETQELTQGGFFGATEEALGMPSFEETARLGTSNFARVSTALGFETGQGDPEDVISRVASDLDLSPRGQRQGPASPFMMGYGRRSRMEQMVPGMRPQPSDTQRLAEALPEAAPYFSGRTSRFFRNRGTPSAAAGSTLEEIRDQGMEAEREMVQIATGNTQASTWQNVEDLREQSPGAANALEVIRKAEDDELTSVMQRLAMGDTELKERLEEEGELGQLMEQKGGKVPEEIDKLLTPNSRSRLMDIFTRRKEFAGDRTPFRGIPGIEADSSVLERMKTIPDVLAKDARQAIRSKSRATVSQAAKNISGVSVQGILDPGEDDEVTAPEFSQNFVSEIETALKSGQTNLDAVTKEVSRAFGDKLTETGLRSRIQKAVTGDAEARSQLRKDLEEGMSSIAKSSLQQMDTGKSTDAAKGKDGEEDKGAGEDKQINASNVTIRTDNVKFRGNNKSKRPGPQGSWGRG